MSATNQLRSVATGENKNPVTAFRDFLEKQKSQIAAALPKHVSPDRMIRLACTEFARNPLLQKCTPVSVFGAIIQSSQLGLEIGVLGQAYLVPYRNNKNNTYEAQFLPGYKGLISLARRSGEVTSIETHIVYEHDKFDLRLGLDTHLEHVPYLEGDRGAARLVYGVAKFRDGGHHFEWMSIGDVNKIRQRSKSRDSGPWVTDYEQMVRKTLIRRMANYLPMSIELQQAIQVSDAAEEGKRATIDGGFVVIEGDGGENGQSATDVDHDTGEVLTNHGDDAAGPTFEDAIAAVKAGDHDLAADMARSFPDGQKAAVLKAIENARTPAAEDKPSGRRPSGSMAIE
jgi:recombination protein RecT